MFLGLHFPGEILVGAVVGMALGFVLAPLISILIQRIDRSSPSRPSALTRPEIAYPVRFLVTFEFATMFDGARHLVHELLEIVT